MVTVIFNLLDSTVRSYAVSVCAEIDDYEHHKN